MAWAPSRAPFHPVQARGVDASPCPPPLPGPGGGCLPPLPSPPPTRRRTPHKHTRTGLVSGDPEAVVAGKGAVVGAHCLQTARQQRIVPRLVLGHLDKVGEKGGGHAVVGVGPKSRHDVPGQIHRPVLDVHQGVQQRLPRRQAPALAPLQLPRLHQPHLHARGEEREGGRGWSRAPGCHGHAGSNSRCEGVRPIAPQPRRRSRVHPAGDSPARAAMLRGNQPGRPTQSLACLVIRAGWSVRHETRVPGQVLAGHPALLPDLPKLRRQSRLAVGFGLIQHSQGALHHVHGAARGFEGMLSSVSITWSRGVEARTLRARQAPPFLAGSDPEWGPFFRALFVHAVELRPNRPASAPLSRNNFPRGHC